MGKSTSKNHTASNPIMMKVTTDPRNVMARDQVQDANNPYTPEFHFPDDTVCSHCGAIYFNQHWNRDDKRRDLVMASGAANEIVCPGCTMVAERNPQGIVYISGDYWPQHREDILNLIRNEEGRGMATNPIERIIDIREEEDALIVETTNTKLAQHIGRALHKAHKGEVDYRWPDGDHLLRAYWERSAADTSKKKAA
jgi:hypothetical protein